MLRDVMYVGPLSAVSNLKSIEEDPCTLYVNWTAPYTLQGVPIRNYIISVTKHSDGAVLLEADIANTTDYFYNVSILGETLDISVAAVNDAGIGNKSTVMTQTPTSSEPIVELLVVHPYQGVLCHVIKKNDIFR